MFMKMVICQKGFQKFPVQEFRAKLNGVWESVSKCSYFFKWTKIAETKTKGVCGKEAMKKYNDWSKV